MKRREKDTNKKRNEKGKGNLNENGRMREEECKSRMNNENKKWMEKGI